MVRDGGRNGGKEGASQDDVERQREGVGMNGAREYMCVRGGGGGGKTCVGNGEGGKERGREWARREGSRQGVGGREGSGSRGRI